MTLADAAAMSGKTIAVYAPFGDKAIEKFADVERATPAEVRLAEQFEAGRIRLFERTHGFTYEQACEMNRREFMDEMTTSEAEALIAKAIYTN